MHNGLIIFDKVHAIFDIKNFGGLMNGVNMYRYQEGCFSRIENKSKWEKGYVSIAINDLNSDY